MKRILFLWCLLISAVSSQAQELTVKRMEVAPMDLTAVAAVGADLLGTAVCRIASGSHRTTAATTSACVSPYSSS